MTEQYVEDYILNLPILSNKDKSNLLFIMKNDDLTIENWHKDICHDDLVYAFELLEKVNMFITEHKLSESTWTESKILLENIKSIKT